MAALALAACSGNPYDDWADTQKSDPEAPKTVTMAVAPAAAIDFSTLTADSVQLFVPTITVADQAVNTYNVVLNGIDGTSTQSVTAGENGMVATADLTSAYYALVGRRPVQRTITIDVTSYTNIGGESVKEQGSTTATLTADAPEIEQNYYITGNINGWNNSDTSFKVTNGGGDVYDDPVFTITITKAQIDAAGVSSLEFKLTPESGLGGDWSKCVSASADGTEGKLADSNAGGNIVMPLTDGAQKYILSFDLLNQTWSYEAITYDANIYEIGNESGWGSTQTLFGTQNDAGKYTGIYYGYVYLNGEYKFKPKPGNSDWSGDWEYLGGGSFTASGSDNFPAPSTAGYYYVKVDLLTMTYSIVPGTIGILGDGAGGWDSDQDMTYNAADNCYEITYTFTDGSFKFRANDAWTINWGGEDLNNLTQNGANIPVTAGRHTVKLYLNYDGTARCTIE